MEELLELKTKLTAGDLNGALDLVETLEEMGRKGLIRNLRSYGVVLLVHLIKQTVEERTTRSWDISIRNAVFELRDLNMRPQGRGQYLDNAELRSLLNEAYVLAVRNASLEVAGGRYEPQDLDRLLDRSDLCDRAWQLVSSGDAQGW